MFRGKLLPFLVLVLPSDSHSDCHPCPAPDSDSAIESDSDPGSDSPSDSGRGVPVTLSHKAEPPNILHNSSIFGCKTCLRHSEYLVCMFCSMFSACFVSG